MEATDGGKDDGGVALERERDAIVVTCEAITQLSEVLDADLWHSSPDRGHVLMPDESRGWTLTFDRRDDDGAQGVFVARA